MVWACHSGESGSDLGLPEPDFLSGVAERRRLELIPEELCRQYTLSIQEALLSELHVNLEDFRYQQRGSFFSSLQLERQSANAARGLLQAEAQHGSDAGRRRAVPVRLGAQKGAVDFGEGMLLRRARPLQDRGYSVSAHVTAETSTYLV